MGMRGKTCIITGGTSGIGKASAIELARQGAEVVLAARTEARGREACRDIASSTGGGTARYIVCDLSSQASIRRFSEEVLASCPRIDVLLHSAGLVLPTREVTEDGLEKSFATTYLSIFLISLLLKERLEESAPARVVIVSGEFHRKATLREADLMSERRYSMLQAGSMATLAKAVFARELAKRMEQSGVTVNALHPGAVRSGLLRNLPWHLRAVTAVAQLFFVSPEKGAETPVFLASSPAAQGLTGKYFIRKKPARPSEEVLDPATGQALWDASLALLRAPRSGEF